MISVIISAYNGEKTLRKCADSFLAQTYKDFEIIIVDDGSSDRTGAISDEYKNKYSNVQVIHKENGGLSSARLAGFLAAKGEFVCFPDCDDYAEPDYLQCLIDNMDENTQISICSFFTDGKTVAEKRLPNCEIEKADFGKKLVLPNIAYIKEKDEFFILNFVWLRLYRKSILSPEFFVSEREVFNEDLLLNFYALKNAEKVKISDRPLYHYVVCNTSLTLKHTPNLWDRYEKRNELALNFCREQGIDVSERYDYLMKNTCISCVRNAKRSRSYKIFSHDCRKIREKYMKCVNFSTCRNMREKIILSLLKLKLWPVLFAIMKNL